jgi:hypothetical protein
MKAREELPWYAAQRTRIKPFLHIGCFACCLVRQQRKCHALLLQIPTAASASVDQLLKGAGNSKMRHCFRVLSNRPHVRRSETEESRRAYGGFNRVTTHVKPFGGLSASSWLEMPFLTAKPSTPLGLSPSPTHRNSFSIGSRDPTASVSWRERGAAPKKAFLFSVGNWQHGYKHV